MSDYYALPTKNVADKHARYPHISQRRNSNELAYSLFVSHSFQDSALVSALQSLKLPGIELYIAEADPRYGESLSEKIEEKIDSCDAVVVFLTKRGGESASVNQEVGYAKKAHKRIIALVEKGASVGVLIQGIERMPFSIDEMAEDLDRLVLHIKSKANDKRQNKLFWIGLSVGMITLVALVIIAIVVSARWRRKKSP